MGTVERETVSELVQSASETQAEIWESWKDAAKQIVVTAMKQRRMTYADLSERLREIGIHESAAQLNRKVNRKLFSTAFFLACLSAMQYEAIPIPTPEERHRARRNRS